MISVEIQPEKRYTKRVQTVVNAARKNGADYVVALTHLGTESVTKRWSAQSLVKNTYGIDVVLDGHSHSTVESLKVKNKKGKNVAISSTGTKFANIGELVITKKGKITTKLISLGEDEETKSYVEGIKDEYNKLLEEVIGKTEVDLISVFPWRNYGCVIEATGQQIKDALEMGAKNYPEENGGFLHVSGLECKKIRI